jgi:small GTP-binding protein
MLIIRQVLTLCIFQIGSSGENQKSAVDELEDNIHKGGLETALKQCNEDLENWKDEPVKLAVIGKSGVGKSSFINTIRNMKPGNHGFATTSCSGNTTEKATVYEYPGNSKITLHDLPGFGTIKFPTNEYDKTMKLYEYDYILIFVRNIEENDLEIAKKIKEMDKPFCFVRSKIDLDILSAKNDGESENDAVEKIISKSLDKLEYAGFNKTNFFVISNHNRKIYQFNDLVSYIERNMSALKCNEGMFSLLGEFTDDIINNKYLLLKDRLLKVVMASVFLDTAPINSMDRLFNKELIVKELLLYHNVFGFEQQSVKDILKDDNIRQKLNANSIIEIQPADKAMRDFFIIELEKLRTSGTRGPQVRLIHVVIFRWPTFILLNQVLDSCRDDAILVYSHIRNVDV